MRIAVIGTGYVGLVTGACLAGFGNDVTCVDVDEEKIRGLQEGMVPFYEPGLGDVILANQRAGRLAFRTSLPEAVRDAQVCFITVGTPSDVDGSADLQYVLEVAEQIGSALEGPSVVVTKSTVPVGTADKVRHCVGRALGARGVSIPYSVASNPEFLREGAAVGDFLHPDRVVVGADTPEAEETLRELYSFLPQEKVRLGIGSDGRIGYAFLSPGCGYGGSCFPKDVRALRHTALQKGYSPRILQAVEDVNEAQKHVLFQKILRHFGGELGGRVLALWGLSFKPNTSDLREASSLVLVQDLLGAGAALRVHDPVALEEARRLLGNRPGLTFVGDHYEALEGADGLVLVTEWDLYKQPNFRLVGQKLREKAIFDGRNQYSGPELRRQGFAYYGVGRP